MREDLELKESYGKAKSLSALFLKIEHIQF